MDHTREFGYLHLISYNRLHKMILVQEKMCKAAKAEIGYNQNPLPNFSYYTYSEQACHRYIRIEM